MQDRYADRRALPSIDASQDWFLTFGEEEDGYTILEFYRNLTSCDAHDLDISVSAMHACWPCHGPSPRYGTMCSLTTINL
jgi:hypothetical protein